jgi:MFS transporter, DHA2 family, glioxin efflux transporter
MQTAPNIDPSKVLEAGASQLGRLFSGNQLVELRSAYMVGVKDVFAFSLAVSAVTILAALLVPFKKLPDTEVKPEENKQDKEVV